MREINLIVIHSSATPNGDMLLPSPDVVIDNMHFAIGYRRRYEMLSKYRPHLKAIGYHYVIGRDGFLYHCRHEDEVGAHAFGWDETSIGICLVGTDSFTKKQWVTLAHIVSSICYKNFISLKPAMVGVVGFKNEVFSPGICGHQDLPGISKCASKRCPGFDVSRWLLGGMKPID